MILYHDWDAFCCVKVRFCLAEKNLPFESRVVDLQNMRQLTPEYLAINPSGVVPTLSDCGRAIFESSVINQYLNEAFPGPDLMPDVTLNRDYARYWVKFEDDVLHPAIKGPTYRLMLRQSFSEMPRHVIEQRIASAPTTQKAEFMRQSLLDGSTDDAENLAAATTTLTVAINKMETRLQEAEWFGGPQFSLADIAIAPLIDRLEALRFAGLWSDLPALSRWIAAIKARPAYHAALPQQHQRIPPPARNSMPIQKFL